MLGHEHHSGILMCLILWLINPHFVTSRTLYITIAYYIMLEVGAIKLVTEIRKLPSLFYPSPLSRRDI